MEGVPRLGKIRGLTESRLFGAEDGSRAIIMSAFENADAYREFQNSATFQKERARLLPLIEGTQAGFYRLMHQRENGG
jgi:heme-degrading monooxygenase HmoA